MDGRSESARVTAELRERSHFVYGARGFARFFSRTVFWILIVMWISQCSSSATAGDWLLCRDWNVPRELPVQSLLDWSVSQDSCSSSTATHFTTLPGSQLSPEFVFGDSNVILENREPCELVSSRLCSDSCTATGCEIFWSLWSDDVTACEFATHDFATLVKNLDNDFLGLWRLENVAFVGSGLGLALGLRDSVDADVREYTAQHPGRWGGFSDTLGVLGNSETQIAGMAILYGYAYHQQDDQLMGFTRLMIRSYTLTGLSTLVVKGIVNSDRPSDRWNNGQFGFPSAHVSTSFAIAATIEEYYGPQAGIPAYLVAGMIGWSRIDQRDHDLSDVLFGAVLGYAIAKSIAGQELRGDSRIRLFPWTDPGNRTLGAMCEVEF